MLRQRWILSTTSSIFIVVFLIADAICEEGKQSQLLKQPRETNPLNFMRLLVMRLVYGMAVLMGFEESLSEFANGAFVPPGVDDDYGGFDYGRDDYAYSDNDDYY